MEVDDGQGITHVLVSGVFEFSDFVEVAEPGTLALIGAGLISFGVLRRQRGRQTV